MDERLMDPRETNRQPRCGQTTLELFHNRVNEQDGRKVPEGGAQLLGDRESSGQTTNSRPPGSKPTKKTKKDPYKGYLKLCISGVVLIVGAFLTHFIDPVQMARDMTMTMKEGSYLYKMWKAPPIKLYIKIFIFNITNAERFIRGQDKRLRVEEIGPYTYSEVVTNEEVVWNENDTISFTPSRNVRFEPDFSIGDPSDGFIFVPNIPLLGLASMLHNSSATLNLAISTLVSYLDAQPILKMPINAFLWGYDDPLVKLATNILPSWINFKTFGILDRLMDEGVNRITMTLNNTNKTKQFSIQRFNGLPGLKVWGYNPEEVRNSTSRCNMVEGTSEGYLFPRNIPKGTPFTVYRKAFCRPLKLEWTGEERAPFPKGFPVYQYKFRDDMLDPDNPENDCYCKKSEGPCLPRGLSDLSPCYYNFPVAISLPHFYKGNRSLSEAVDGLSPNAEKHDTMLTVQPDTGVPLSVKIRLQTNLVMKKTKLIPRVRPFNNLAIPIFWMQVELLSLPFSVNFLMVLLLQIGPTAQRVGIILAFVAGLSLVFVGNLRYAWESGILNSRRTATLISYRQKQKKHERAIWRNGRYSSLLGGAIRPELPPPAASQEERTR